VTVELDSVLTVEKGQRVLLKIRPSLRQALKDSECPGLHKELDLQPRKFRVSKRSAEDELVSPLPEKVSRISQTRTTVNNSMRKAKATTPTSTPDTTAHKKQPYANTNPYPVAKAVQPSQPSPLDSALLCSTQLNTVTPDVKSRNWPHHFYVCEIRDGLLEMSKLLGTAFSRRRSKNNRFNKRNAFVRAFPGVRYVKTTVWKYKKVWDDSDEGIRELFTDLGKVENAYFEHFLAALDNPHLLPSAPDESDSQSSDSQSNHEDEHTISDPPERTILPSMHPQTPDKGKAREEPTRNVVAMEPHHIWPVDINFDSLHYRVKELQEILEEILFEPVESEIFHSLVIMFKAGSSGAQNAGLGNGVSAG
jgi:hypothetical protein